MLDIGTNTEMILGNKYGLAACSAASGPAFEGAKIQCGMRGLPGAIDHVKYEDGKWQYTTIGGEKPVGLCGSGLIDLVAELLRTGLLDENGILHSGQERSDWFMLVPPQETGFAQCGQNMSEDEQSKKMECLQRTKKMGVDSRVSRMIAESILPRKTSVRYSLPKQPLPLESNSY